MRMMNQIRNPVPINTGFLEKFRPDRSRHSLPTYQPMRSGHDVSDREHILRLLFLRSLRESSAICDFPGAWFRHADTFFRWEVVHPNEDYLHNSHCE